jgi:hypothetical protein
MKKRFSSPDVRHEVAVFLSDQRPEINTSFSCRRSVKWNIRLIADYATHHKRQKKDSIAARQEVETEKL